MAIWIYDCDGATTDDVQRGVDAANKVFEKHKTTAEIEHGYKIPARKGINRLGPDHEYPGLIWHKAETAALDACCNGWLSIPEAAHLELEVPA